jgi:serine protease Do
MPSVETRPARSRRSRARAAGVTVVTSLVLTLAAALQACTGSGTASADAAPLRDAPGVAELAAASLQDTAGHDLAPQRPGGPGTGGPLATSSAGARLGLRRTVITDAVARIAPSVVTVQTEIVQHETDPLGGFFGGQAQDRTTPGLGSGFVVRSDGVIVTNAHVVAGASRVEVALRDGTTYTAKVLGADEINDLAVLRIQAIGLPVAPLGNSDSLLIGEWAIAIGNPYGFYLGNPEPSVTAGVISAVGRNLVGQAEGNGMYVDMIQTDAAINPGNSGGPLLDSSGDVVGMNTAVAGTLPDGTSAQNIGFAIPDATIESLLKQLKAGESVINHGAFIGVEITTETPSLKAEYHFSVSSGAVVMSVISGTGAAAAGVKQGDIIVGINNTSIGGAQDVSSVTSALRPGDVITLHIVRGSKHLAIKVTLGTEPKG